MELHPLKLILVISNFSTLSFLVLLMVDHYKEQYVYLIFLSKQTNMIHSDMMLLHGRRFLTSLVFFGLV